MSKTNFKPTKYKIEAEDETGTVLGPLESDIMQVAWKFGDRAFSVRDVFEELRKDRKIAYTTVMTTMTSLHKKGLFTRTVEKGKGGLLYMYNTTMTKGEMEKKTIRDVLSSLGRNFRRDLLTSSFIDEMQIGEKELRKYLKRAKGGEDQRDL